MVVNVKNMIDDELFFGHKACAGCGGSLALRAALKVLGPNAVAALPAGCMSAVGFNFPQLAFANNAMITPFAATASVLTGIEAGLRAQGKKPDDCTVVGFAGDGGTADIGLQALSGAIDRNDDVLYICYDNEAYMNTGIQKSSLTPFGAKTTTTPAGSNVHGCLTQKKNLFEIVAAHGIPYAATASVGYLNDFIRKVERARDVHGTRYIHVIAPCPTGWGCGVDETVDIAKDIVDTGLWYLAEYEGERVSGQPGGRFRLNRDPKQFASVPAYLRRQGRFRALSDDEVAAVEQGNNEGGGAMRFIVSPAKKMSVVDDSFACRSLPQFIDDAERLLGALRALSYDQAKELWGCSDALAELNFERVRTMDLRAEGALTPAVVAYEGIQYQHLALRVMDEAQLAYVQEHLRILSGFYGVLRPLDGVVPYRLEMQAKLAAGDAPDLYAFWGDRLYRTLADETDVIVNLASVEYAKAVLPHAKAAGMRAPRIVTCLFGTIDAQGRLKQRATAAKAARGSMVRWCAEHNVQHPEGLCAFDQLGHVYDEARSTDDCLVFVQGRACGTLPRLR